MTAAGRAVSRAAEPEVERLPTVDIVIDNYNYGRFLESAIRSALDQSHGQVTVIVVDDGSVDESREVMRSFGDDIVPVLKENGGQASAFNAGLERSTADVVVFLDADDMLHRDAARRVAELFRDSRNLAKVHYRLAVIDEEGARTGEIRPSPHIPLPQGDLRTAMTRFPFDLARPGTSGNAFATWVLRQIAPVPVGWQTAADWYLVYVAALYGPVGAIDEALGFYRIHGSNWHASADASVDVEHVRATIARTGRARDYLEEAAAGLGLPWDSRDASMCEVADRAISLKLDPAGHPVPRETATGLVRLGARAAKRRFDVGVPMRAAFVAWLLALTVSPRPLATKLAALFLHPEQRGALNRWLGKLHRRR